jgi:asparagine synthase (glutamine-hydrolysing)
LYPGSIGRVTKISDLLGLKDLSCVYDYFLQGANPRELIMDQYHAVSSTNFLVPDGISDVEKMMFLDTKGYLVDDVLVKVDRASMAAGLETRAPFLNHHIVEFSWSLPLSFKIKGNLGKFPLRQILNQYIPKSLVNRPKMGFAVPLSSWLRGPLHDWAEDLLSEQRLRQGGYLKPELVRQMWSEHLKGTRDWQRPLWNILMLQAWLDMEREP